VKDINFFPIFHSYKKNSFLKLSRFQTSVQTVWITDCTSIIHIYKTCFMCSLFGCNMHPRDHPFIIHWFPMPMRLSVMLHCISSLTQSMLVVKPFPLPILNLTAVFSFIHNLDRPVLLKQSPFMKSGLLTFARWHYFCEVHEHRVNRCVQKKMAVKCIKNHTNRFR